MIKKTITVEGRDVTLASSGYLPFFYREKIGRDLVKDMSRLMAGYKKLMSIPEDAPVITAILMLSLLSFLSQHPIVFPFVPGCPQ